MSGMREVLREQAFRDPLTGLYNRRFLREALDLELRRAKRNHLPVALIMLDVDRFKDFNDTYGHAAGDCLLQAMANSLQVSVRSNDVVCRYGNGNHTSSCPSRRGKTRSCELAAQVHSQAFQYRLAGQDAGGTYPFDGHSRLP